MAHRESSFQDIDIGPSSGPPSHLGGSPVLISRLRAFYRHWARMAVRHRYAIMAICSVVSTLGALKVFTTPFKNDINGFTPYGARSLEETAIRDHFYSQREGEGTFGVLLLVLPRQKGANMLQPRMLDEVTRIDEIVNWNLTLHNRATNRSEGFAEFCRAFCNANEPVHMFIQGMRAERAEGDADLGVSLDYPTIEVWGRRMNIQPYFHGIKFRGGKGNGGMEFAEMVALIYRGERGPARLSEEEAKEYDLRVSKYFEKWMGSLQSGCPTLDCSQFHSDSVRVLSISVNYVEAEFVRASMQMLPFLGLGFTVMALCASICIPLSAAYFQQATVHKVSLAIVACICPLMATATAMGLLFVLGVRFSSILCATPFLVLAIGVDDAYLMTHAWNGEAKKHAFLTVKRRNGDGEGTEEEEEDQRIVAQILESVLIDTGPAVLVSALANILADTVGCFIGSPEITLLCLANIAGLVADFFFQCTYFVAVMATVALIERRELRKKSAGAKVRDVAASSAKAQRDERTSWQVRFHDNSKEAIARLLGGYVDVVSSWKGALLICLLWSAYIAVSIVGITRFEVNMSSRLLYSSDSPLLEIDNIRETRISIPRLTLIFIALLIHPFYTLSTVFVNTPGDLFHNKSRLSAVNSLVHEMENMQQSWGTQSTMLFLRDFMGYLRKEQQDQIDDGDYQEDAVVALLRNKDIRDQFNCERLREFLAMTEYAHWADFVRLRNTSIANGTSSCSVDSFYFTTAFHGGELKLWTRRAHLLNKWREIVDEYADTLSASVYHEEAIYLDLVANSSLSRRFTTPQMNNMPTDTWQAALATLVCMGLVCLVMLQDWRTVCFTTAVIAAIIVETMGTLSWSGVALNQLMMGSLIISIGFSVDLPAHFSYHYLTADSQGSARDRLGSAIRSVGLPSILASLSTSLCVLSHYFVDLYIARIFVRIMCLTILLCLLNTLVLLPALLSLASRLTSGRKGRA